MDAPLPEPFKRLRLDKASPVPAYVQIAEAISGLLKQNAFPPGYPMPPERILCDQFGVSRMTLRQAMGILERDGLLLSRRGRGTFVAHDLRRKQQQEMRSFSEEILARGGVPESKLLSFQAIAPPPAAMAFFGIPASGRVYEIKRTRLSNQVPLALETALLSGDLCPRLEQFDLSRNSLYRVLEEEYGLRLETCTEEVSAELPTPEHRKVLALPRDVAVLVIHRKSYTEFGQPLELGHSVYRGDLYSAVVHSIRKKPLREK